MDFIAEVAAGNKPEARSIDVDGKQGTVYVRKLTGQQKLQLLHGRKYTVDGSTQKVGMVEIDLGENEKESHLLVKYCICDENGRPRFKALEDVSSLPTGLIAALAQVARDHNRNAVAPEEEPGEA